MRDTHLVKVVSLAAYVQKPALRLRGPVGAGNGPANKLRAYRLQDGVLDTIEADQHLGFRGEERDFSVAAAML